MPESASRKEMVSTAPQLVTRGNVLMLFAALTLFAALIGWLLFGTVRTSFTAIAVLTTKEDARILYSPGSGVVTSILVQEYQYVREGDVLATIFPIDESSCSMSLSEMEAQAREMVSPVNGFVTEISAQLWEHVDQTSALMLVKENASEALSYAVTYLPVDDADNVKIGNHVHLRVQGSSDLTQGGLLEGNVISISDFPAADYRMNRFIGSQNTVRLLYQENIPQYRVLIELETDADGQLDYTGTNARSRAFLCNEMCAATFFSEEMHPWQVIAGMAG